MPCKIVKKLEFDGKIFFHKKLVLVKLVAKQMKTTKITFKSIKLKKNVRKKARKSKDANNTTNLENSLKNFLEQNCVAH